MSRIGRRTRLHLDTHGLWEPKCQKNRENFADWRSVEQVAGAVFVSRITGIEIFLAALLVCVPILRAQEAPTSTRPLMAQAAESRLVWVNTATGMDNYSGTRWYRKDQARQIHERSGGSVF